MSTQDHVNTGLHGKDDDATNVSISRLIDGAGRAADWHRLRDAVAADAAVWDNVIAQAIDTETLADGLDVVLTSASATSARASDLPGLLSEPGVVTAPRGTLSFPQAQRELVAADVQPAAGRRTDRHLRSARLGWLVAACLGLGLVSVSLRPGLGGGSGAGGGAHTAGLSLDQLTTDDFLNGWKARAAKEGTLVAEIPQRLVLESRPSADGKGREILYMRQFIERAVVDDLYKFGTDDAGRPVMVPATIQTPRPAGAM